MQELFSSQVTILIDFRFMACFFSMKNKYFKSENGNKYQVKAWIK